MLGRERDDNRRRTDVYPKVNSHASWRDIHDVSISATADCAISCYFT